MKKGQWYFNQLTKKQQTEFKENTEKLNPTEPKLFDFILNQVLFTDKYEFLTHAFHWSKSPQGFDYWYLISKTEI